MGRKCSVAECGSNYESRLRLGRHATSTFKFPDDPSIREQWVAAVARPDGWQPKKTSCICMNHFRKDDFEKLSKPAKLKPDAVPTLFGTAMAEYEPIKKPSGPPEELNIDFESFYGRVLEKTEFAGWHFYKKKQTIHFYTVKDSDRDSAIEIVNSIKIYEDMKINVFNKEVRLSDAVVRRVLGRDLKLCRWSQFEALLKKYELKSKISEPEESIDVGKRNKRQKSRNDIQMVTIPEHNIKSEPTEDGTDLLQDEMELDMEIVKEETNVPQSDEDSEQESDHSPEEKMNLYETLQILSEAKHKCFICNREHETSEQYDYHLTDHMDMLPYECDRCVTEKVVIRSLPSLNKHFLMHLKPLKCRTCDARFTIYKSRLIHEKSFHVVAEPLACEICKETFLSQKRLNKHMKNHTELESVSCKICEKQFITAYDLDLHTKSVHPSSAAFNYEELSTLDPDVTLDFNAPLENANKKPKKDFFCIQCNKHLANSNSYYSHMQGHRKQFQCGYCGVRIARLRDFRDHENTHTGKRPYECDICKMRFMAASTYYGHKATHKGEKKFACETCGRQFSRREHMVSHANIHKKLTRRGRKAAKKDAETTEAVPNDEATAAMDEPSPDNNLETNIETNAEDDVGQTEMET
ncbi:AAEL008867-PA [Aedes aegypti]|uniref:AAEL008867-PA n=1 Tax=Aedes aegypti TaxID=7159 RepID=Q16XH9_AEDAE|nr:AAEL008867-PA [Aedes aegypti]